jgi:hypothetical protein
LVAVPAVNVTAEPRQTDDDALTGNDAWNTERATVFVDWHPVELNRPVIVYTDDVSGFTVETAAAAATEFRE